MKDSLHRVGPHNYATLLKTVIPSMFHAPQMNNSEMYIFSTSGKVVGDERVGVVKGLSFGVHKSTNLTYWVGKIH